MFKLNCIRLCSAALLAVVVSGCANLLTYSPDKALLYDQSTQTYGCNKLYRYKGRFVFATTVVKWEGSRERPSYMKQPGALQMIIYDPATGALITGLDGAGEGCSMWKILADHHPTWRRYEPVAPLVSRYDLMIETQSYADLAGALSDFLNLSQVGRRWRTEKARPEDLPIGISVNDVIKQLNREARE